jgi:CheY-like chemotaxis protein/HPt (histidine-containing phosphotransfer) domain-containing protein
MRSDSARGGSEALERLRSAAAQDAPYELVILDMRMPGMNGLELARAITDEPRLGAPRLILLTSMGTRSRDQAIQEAGIDAWLTKPVRQSPLYDSIATVMGHAAAAVEPEVAHPSLLPAPARFRARILVVEDNAVNQKVAVRLLEKLGYRADVAASGHEALEALARRAYALVLMDCQMPEMDGFEATAAIRQAEGTARHTPIVAMTANAMAGDRERCLAVGMDDYVSKPVQPRELAATLKRWVPASAPAEPPSATPSADAPGDSRLDTSTLAALGDSARGGDPAFLREIVTIFLEDTPQHLRDLREAAAARESATLVRVAHTLKSSSSYLGARRLAELCEDLERAGRGGDLRDVVAQVEDVGAEIEYVRAAFEKEQRRWAA